ncbi:MAG: redoxin domain-containing protein [Gemmatimonadetes bacterium]|nr:redoxin domain-containing protein [Gemmatimonadota bacterium]
MRDEQSTYTAKGVQTLGMNPASVASHEKYAAKFHFGFPLVSDPERSAALAYRALKADGHGIVRTVYLVGRDGRVAFAERGAPAVDAILAVLG